MAGGTVKTNMIDETRAKFESDLVHENLALVQYVTSQRSGGSLSTSQLCVALVAGTGTVYVRTGGVYSTGTNATFPTTGCFDDGNVDSGLRVHVSAVRNGDKINLVFGQIPITVSSRGTARYEQPEQ
jgi:hypothetical protein